MPMAVFTTLQLTPAEIAEFDKPINGKGGDQTLLKMLRDRVDRTSGELRLTDAELGKVVRYTGYGGGGFQGRFKAAFRRSFKDAMK